MKADHPKAASHAAAAGEGIQWSATGDAEAPYAASVNGENWVIRINDFPDEHLYTLVDQGRDVEDFDDWPPSWSRPESASSAVGSPVDRIALTEAIEALRAAWQEAALAGESDANLAVRLRSIEELVERLRAMLAAR